MGWILPFIVLIEPPPAAAGGLIAAGHRGAGHRHRRHAGKPGKPRKLARDMEVAVNSPVQPG